MEKLPEMATNGVRSFVCRTNPDLANLMGDTDVDFENLYFLDFLDTKFLHSQIAKLLILLGATSTIFPWPQNLFCF